MLCGYHHKLIYRGTTTNEDYKKTYRDNQGSPYNLFGYFTNLKRVLFRKLSKPLLNKDLLCQESEEQIEIEMPEINPDVNDEDLHRRRRNRNASSPRQRNVASASAEPQVAHVDDPSIPQNTNPGNQK